MTRFIERKETKLTTQQFNHFVKMDGTQVVAAQGIETTHEPIAKHMHLHICESPACECHRWRHNAQASNLVRKWSPNVSFFAYSVAAVKTLPAQFMMTKDPKHTMALVL
jgi:hypothetical protein